MMVSQGCKDHHWTCLRYRAGLATSAEMLGITQVGIRLAARAGKQTESV